MHSHETCEQLMAAAQRAGKYGRLGYLSWRCDRAHGDLTDPRAEEARAATRCDMRHGEQNVPNEQEEAS